MMKTIYIIVYITTFLLSSFYYGYKPINKDERRSGGIKDDSQMKFSTDFNQPLNIYSQKSMISSSARVLGTVVLARSLISRSVNAVEICKECGVVGCKSSLCIVAAEMSPPAWYNPDNERIFDTFHKSYVPARPELYLSNERLEGRKIFTIGETHTNPICHKLELDIIRPLAMNSIKNGGKMAIGLECFHRQHQLALDRFIYIHHNLGRLKRDTDWDNSWGYDLNYYAKIFNFARLHGIRLVGLNVPYQVAKLVGEVGLANVPSNLRKLLPEIDLGVNRHREQFEAAIGAFGGHETMNTDAFDRMYQVQTLWDEYMAESAAMYISKNKDDIFVTIAGVGHIAGRVGIPDRISKRIKNADPFVIVPQQVDWIKSNGLPDVPDITLPLSSEDCDWGWYTEKELIV